MRKRLLGAALDVFARDGYHSATLDDVAAHAGLTKGAIYSNFKGKRELFLALLEEQVAQRADIARDTLLTAVSGSGVNRAVLAGALASRLEEIAAADEDWQKLYIEFWLFAMRDAEAGRLLTAARRRLRQNIANLATEMEAHSGIRTGIKPQDWATIILAISNGLALERLIDPDSASGDLFREILNRLTHTPADA